MPSFYGNGIRLALSAKYRLIANLTIAIKGGYSRYFDRDVIGSSTEQIDGNHRTDIFTYLKWQF
jgi:ribosome-associated toxin RatA of RatAB toxin-antitoxin module